MALDNKRSVYEIAIEIGGKLKQSLGTATSGANKKLSGLAVYADKTARATTALSKAINGMMLVKGVSWVSGHMISIGKSAIAAASEMETYRTTLNTVLRDEEKAADMMRWSTEFAAHTPYNTGDIVDAVTRLEAYGFKSQAMLENIGNMASAMNKDLPTAVEAVYKATLGEMELMENNFAITKKLINEKAQEWYGQAVIDASKKITDTEMYTNTLLRLIEEKFEGGMEAQSRTWAGIKSNMEDSRDAIFRRIVGMDAAGEATEDGLYARMLRMGQRAADSLSAFAESDVLDEWAAKLGDTVENLAGQMGRAAKEHAPAIKDFALGTKDLLVESVNLVGELLPLIETYLGSKLSFYTGVMGGTADMLKWIRGETDVHTAMKGVEENVVKITDAFLNPINKLFGTDWHWKTAEEKEQELRESRGNILAATGNSIIGFTPASGGQKTTYEITVHATGMNGTMGDEIAEAVAKRIEAVETAKEAAHYNARVSLRPNKMQTAY